MVAQWGAAGTGGNRCRRRGKRQRRKKRHTNLRGRKDVPGITACVATRWLCGGTGRLWRSACI
jgi:hypothetical protein